MLPAPLRCVLAALLIVALPVAAHAAGKATVRGADSVNVRQAPSTDSPTLLSLPKGRVVTVEKVVGDWAVITLASGKKGYVRAIYLALPAGLEVGAGPTATPERSARALPSPPMVRAASSVPTPPTTAAAMPTETPVASGTPSAAAEMRADKGLEREVADLRHRLAALESAVVATPAAGAEAGEDPAQPPAAADGEREPTRAPVFVPTAAQVTDPQEIGPSLALAGVGLLIGFLLGAAYGQRQERNRRTRVRF